MISGLPRIPSDCGCSNSRMPMALMRPSNRPPRRKPSKRGIFALVTCCGSIMAVISANWPGIPPCPKSDPLSHNLSFQGEVLFRKPGEFEAFPLLGRIPHSERVISQHFLGLFWQGPVFTVSYRCHQDTATAFRAFAQQPKRVGEWMAAWKGELDSLDWGREIHFQGQDEFRRPLIFWKFSEAVMGFAGLFGPIFGFGICRKNEKNRHFMALIGPKP